MRLLRSKRIWGLTSLALVVTSVGIPLAADPPSLSTIVEHVINRANEEQQQLQVMQYRQDASIDELDDSGHVVAHQQRISIIRPGTLEPVEIISVQGDVMPADSWRRRRHANLSENIQKGRETLLLAKLAPRFNLVFEGTSVENGSPVYQIAFTPRADQSADSLIEEVLYHLRGRLWISAVNYSILRAESDLPQPLALEGFLFQIQHLEFSYKFDGKDIGALGPAHIDVSALATSPLMATIHQRQHMVLSDFRKR